MIETSDHERHPRVSQNASMMSVTTLYPLGQTKRLVTSGFGTCVIQNEATERVRLNHSAEIAVMTTVGISLTTNDVYDWH